jgi:fumarate reductase subunit C
MVEFIIFELFAFHGKKRQWYIYIEDYCLNPISVIWSGALNSYKSYMVRKLLGRMSIFALWILSQKLTTILE